MVQNVHDTFLQACLCPFIQVLSRLYPDFIQIESGQSGYAKLLETSKQFARRVIFIFRVKHVALAEPALGFKFWGAISNIIVHFSFCSLL